MALRAPAPAKMTEQLAPARMMALGIRGRERNVAEYENEEEAEEEAKADGVGVTSRSTFLCGGPVLGAH